MRLNNFKKQNLQKFELYLYFTQRELKGKYKRTWVGQFWSLANPIALMIVYTFVFSVIIKIDLPKGEPSGLNSFPLWLLSGLIPWLFFSNALKQGMTTIVANESLIRKVFFPTKSLVLASISSVAVSWVFEMAVVIVALLIAGAFETLYFLPLVAFFMLMMFLFTAGLSLFFSIVNTYFRDTEHLVGIALQLGMYISPVVYPISLVAIQSQAMGPLFFDFTLLNLYELNPMVSFMDIFRDLLYNNAYPDLFSMIYAFLWSVSLFIFGWVFFSKHEKKLAEIL